MLRTANHVFFKGTTTRSMVESMWSVLMVLFNYSHCQKGETKVPYCRFKIQHATFVFFNFLEAFLHQETYDVDMLGFRVFLLSTWIQLSPQSGTKARCGDVVILPSFIGCCFCFVFYLSGCLNLVSSPTENWFDSQSLSQTLNNPASGKHQLSKFTRYDKVACCRFQLFCQFIVTI